MSAPAKPARIRYALGGAEGPQYFSGSALTRPGTRGPWNEDEDNPLAPNFRPLDDRNDKEKARWWALHGKKSYRPSHGEYDAKPAQSR